MRSRKIYFGVIILTIVLGLLSRKIKYLLPDILNLYLGDAIWAVMIYTMLAFIFVHKSSKHVAIFSLVFCYAIEASQLYQAPWINSIRNTTIGALIIGSGFLWSDLIAYLIGILFAFMFEVFLRIPNTPRQQ